MGSLYCKMTHNEHPEWIMYAHQKKCSQQLKLLRQDSNLHFMVRSHESCPLDDRALRVMHEARTHKHKIHNLAA